MGKGPDLVLIHGTGGNTRDMTFSLAPRLASNYRVIVLDRPGLGYTDPISAKGDTITAQARLLQRAAESLGAERPVVIGHSYGGAVALAWAIDMPDRLAALALVASPSHPWTTPLDPVYAAIAHPLAGPIVVPLLAALLPPAYAEASIAGVFAPQEPPAGYVEAIGAALALRRTSLRATGLQRAGLLSEISAMAPRYGAIDIPVEILHGTADTTVSPAIHAEAMARDIPGAVYTALYGIGHMPHHAAEDATVAMIDRAAARAGLR